MNDLELIFSMLGEAATTEITRNRDTRGFDENKQAAVDGGSVAGNARKELEAKSGKKVVSKENYLPGETAKKLPKNKTAHGGWPGAFITDPKVLEGLKSKKA